MVVGRPGEQVIHTMEPRLSSLAFPLYPPLPATTDGSRIEEIRRTILVTNLDPKTTGDQVRSRNARDKRNLRSLLRMLYGRYG